MIDKIIGVTIMLSSLWGIIRYFGGYEEDLIVLVGGVYMFGIGVIIFLKDLICRFAISIYLLKH